MFLTSVSGRVEFLPVFASSRFTRGSMWLLGLGKAAGQWSWQEQEEATEGAA